VAFQSSSEVGFVSLDAELASAEATAGALLLEAGDGLLALPAAAAAVMVEVAPVDDTDAAVADPALAGLELLLLGAAAALFGAAAGAGSAFFSVAAAA